MALAAKLTCADEDGRMITDPAQGTLKFLLLNTAASFSQARPLSPQTRLLQAATHELAVFLDSVSDSTKLQPAAPRLPCCACK